MWDELTILWNDLNILWNDLTIDWNDLIWNDLTMERNDRIPVEVLFTLHVLPQPSKRPRRCANDQQKCVNLSVKALKNLLV